MKPSTTDAQQASPAPTATPLIADTIGVSQSIIVRTMSPASRITRIVWA